MKILKCPWKYLFMNKNNHLAMDVVVEEVEMFQKRKNKF